MSNECFKVTSDSNPKDLIGMNKPPLSLVPPALIIHTAMGMKNGAIKYGPYNWRDKKVQARIYIDAALRHILEWLDGEENAADSGVHHLGHAAACLGILLDAQENDCLIDDRPKKGTAAALVEQFTERKPAPVNLTGGAIGGIISDFVVSCDKCGGSIKHAQAFSSNRPGHWNYRNLCLGCFNSLK
jgi:hypothetical protein